LRIDNQFSKNEKDSSKKEFSKSLNQDMSNDKKEVALKESSPQKRVLAEQLKRNPEELIKSLQPTFQAIGEMQERMHEVIQPIISFQEGMQKTLQPLSRMIGDVRQRIITTLESIDFKKIHDAAKILEKNTIRFKAIMLEIGFPPHDSIPLSHISYFVRIYDEIGIDYAKRLISRYMTLVLYREEELRTMQKKWQRADWLEKRIKVLNSALDGHIQGYYDLTIPTLLAQIEGMLVEGILSLDEPVGKIGYKVQENFLAQVILGDTNTFSFDEEIEKIYTTIILAEFERGKEVESELSRHAILHGEDVKYGTKLNSLKAILIFDYLFNKLNELYYDIEKSKQEIRKRRRRTKKGHNRRYANNAGKGRMRNKKSNNKDNMKRNNGRE
jgi:hypothetical protein